MMRRCSLSFLVALSFTICAAAAEARPAKQLEKQFSALVRPIRAEAGPLLSPAMSPISENHVFGSLGFLWAERERGRTTYRTVAGSLVLGGEWQSPKLPTLALGGDMVALQITNLQTDLPPAIDEGQVFVDLGVVRLHSKFMVFHNKVGKAYMAISPFLRVALPTDTSRNNESRQTPIRRVLDDRVALASYMLIEPGMSLGVLLHPVTFTMHQSPVFAPIYGEVFHFLWSMHYGFGANIMELLDITLETTWLGRLTKKV